MRKKNVIFRVMCVEGEGDIENKLKSFIRNFPLKRLKNPKKKRLAEPRPPIWKKIFLDGLDHLEDTKILIINGK